MYLLPIYFCLFSFLLSFFFGHKCSSKGSVFINVFSILISLLLSFFLFYEVCILHVNSSITLVPWMHLGSFCVYWSFLFDSISCTMLIVILFVSFCANFYSVEYMLYDAHKIRFFSYLSLFTFTMLMLVTSNNIVQLFFGWECVGISSYLLINFWYTRLPANKSSILAIMANKAGDVFLLFSCLLLLYLCNSLYFNNIFLYTDHTFKYFIDLYRYLVTYDVKCYFLYHKESLFFILFNDFFLIINIYLKKDILFFIYTFISLFVILASICKSAQSGFHFWLAEAMEGPTPVSSLLHAATMVTAGIFLTVRCSFFFTYSHYIPVLVIFIGALTSFFSSLIGFTQNDIKKIVAYSTCSQLGFMFLSNGLFSYNITMFHLFNHAFFKALLFLTSGYIIHIMSNEQDLRKMGGLIKIIPLPYICLLIGSIALMGIPYLSGFFSKDTIVESISTIFLGNYMYLNSYSVVFFSQLLISLSCIFTILYSIKIIYYCFITSYNGFFNYINNIHFSSFFIILPLIILSFLSILSGFILSDFMIGISTLFWKNSLKTFLYSYNILLTSTFFEFNNTSLILLPFYYNKFTYYNLLINTIYFSGFIFIFYNYVNYLYLYSIGIFTYYSIIYTNITYKVLFFNRLWINKFLNSFFIESYNSTYLLLDKNIFEIIGPFGITSHVKYFSSFLRTLSTGLIFHYIGIIIIFILFFLIIIEKEFTLFFIYY